MGTDDTINHHRGREAEWAALCAFDGVQASDEVYHEDAALSLIEAVWEFVVATCNEEHVEPPSKNEAITILQALIAEYHKV